MIRTKPALGLDPRVESGLSENDPPAMAGSCFAHDGFFCSNVASYAIREEIMAKDQRPGEEFSAMAEQTKEQALAAADNYFGFLKKTISSYPSGGTEFGDSFKSYAERNIDAVHEFVRKLSRAKDFQEAFRIQAEFMQSQFTALSEQTRSLGEAYTRSASDTVNKFGKTP
jgi:hypothetical protein